MKYFLSLIEEFWQGQKEGTFIGRLEYGLPDQEFTDEFAIGAFDRDGVEKLREKYDLKTVDEETLKKIEKEIERLNKEEKKHD